MTHSLLLKTSKTHPLNIATIKTGYFDGNIGLSLCPGKTQPSGLTGAWSRDLDLDLDVIRGAGYAVVVTLIEQHEIDALGVTRIGDEVLARHMDWIHLPIRDVSVPDGPFEQSWQSIGEGLRARLRDGFSVFLHCKGGLGRAGTVAARLLIELGTPPSDAITQVRHARPGAIETQAQERYVRACQPIDPMQPARDRPAIVDRALGAMLGLAVGDAVGTTLEFSPRDTRPLLNDMVGGGPFRLLPGEWTDDTAMALALADSLAFDPKLDPTDLMDRFVQWHETGRYSCTGSCFDSGITTRQALQRYRQTGNPLAGSTDPMTAGNGSLMRLAPVAIRHAFDADMRAQVATRQSQTTHAAPEAVDGCVAFADILADAITGTPRLSVLRDRTAPRDNAIAPILTGSWRGKHRNKIRSTGYVAHSLEAALWSIGRTADFRSAILTAANLGDDADTGAAITGQLAGALYGLSGIPTDWLRRLAWYETLIGAAERLLEPRDTTPTT